MACTKQTTHSEAAASLAKKGQPTPAQQLAMQERKIAVASKKPKSKAAGDKGMLPQPLGPTKTKIQTRNCGSQTNPTVSGIHRTFAETFAISAFGLRDHQPVQEGFLFSIFCI